MRNSLAALVLMTSFVRLSAQQGYQSIPLQGTMSPATAVEPSRKQDRPVEMPKQGPVRGPVRTAFVFQKKASVTFSAVTKDFSPSLIVREMPGRRRTQPLGIIPDAARRNASTTQSVNLQPLTKGQSLFGNGWDYYVPNDNDLAISDSGIVVSVINCQFMTRNMNTSQVTSKSLQALTTSVNQSNQTFDPKVIYDPLYNRFMFVTLVGFRDSTSKAVVGFSASDDPTGLWHLYVIPGNPLNNNLWSDFPMIADSKKELFFTVNLLYEDSTWQKGFVQTLIWQMSKDSGYAGKSLATFLHSDIKYNGRPLRNICPVKGGSGPHGPGMYFLSNRNFAAQNDTVFLIRVADTLGAPNSSVTISAIKNSQPYYFPSDGRQPLPTQSLVTNDSRNLGAFYENDIIQYVHNTNNPANGHPTIYYGVIRNPGSGSPSASGYIISNDTMDFGYPNISYTGLDSLDNSAIISFDHTSTKVFPGCSALQADPAGNFSPILRIQNGTSYVDVFNDSLNTERWGDYSGSQRRYNKPGEVWMSGFVGCIWNNYKAHRTWIAQLNTYDGLHVGIAEQQKASSSSDVYPNPTQDVVEVKIHLPEPEYLSFEIHDVQGRLVEVLMRDWVRGRENIFTFRTESLSKGVYFLYINGNKQTKTVKKIIVN